MALVTRLAMTLGFAAIVAAQSGCGCADEITPPRTITADAGQTALGPIDTAEADAGAGAASCHLEIDTLIKDNRSATSATSVLPSGKSIVGWEVQTNGLELPALWRDAGIERITRPDIVDGIAVDIGEDGSVGGNVRLAGQSPRAFLLSADGGWIVFPAQTRLNRLSHHVSGTVAVGQVGRNAAELLADGGIRLIALGSAFGISSRGVIAASLQDAGSARPAVIHPDGTVAALPADGDGAATCVLDLADAGLIVGGWMIASQQRPALWENGRSIPLSGEGNVADISNLQVLVGTRIDETGAPRAAAWRTDGRPIEVRSPREITPISFSSVKGRYAAARCVIENASHACTFRIVGCN